MFSWYCGRGKVLELRIGKSCGMKFDEMNLDKIDDRKDFEVVIASEV